MARRHPNWNYSYKGYYFITIVTEKRTELLSEIKNNQVHLTSTGEIVRNEWLDLKNSNQLVKLDVFVIMPDHFHGLLKIENDSLRNSYMFRGEMSDEDYRKHRRLMTISKLIGKFKMRTTKLRNIQEGTEGERLWMKNYSDVIVEDLMHLSRVREYILNNPKNWNRE